MMTDSLFKDIESFDKIAIFRHQRPDGDAAFSQAAFSLYLKENYPDKDIKCLGDDECDLLPFHDEVSTDWFDDSLAIVLDTSNRERISDQRYSLCKRIIKIDHHPAIDLYGNINLTDPSCAACCQLLYELFKQRGGYISDQVCEYLLCGLLTDTLCFHTANTTSDTLFCASELLKRSRKNIADLYVQLFNDPLDTFHKLTKIRQELICEDEVGYVILDREKLQEIGISAEDAKNHITEFNNISDLKIWGIFVENEKGTYDGSVRSKKSYYINEIMQIFGGGGHPNACGIKSIQRSTIISLLCEFKNKIKKVD